MPRSTEIKGRLKRPWPTSVFDPEFIIINDLQLRRHIHVSMNRSNGVNNYLLMQQLSVDATIIC